MPIRRYRAQRLAIRLEEQPVQVVANILLRHREMCLVDEPPEFPLLETQRLLRADLLDDGEFGRGQTREREAAAAGAQRHALALRAQRDAGLLGQRTENIEQLAPGYGDVAPLRHAHLARGNQFHLEVGSRHTQTIFTRRQQDIREYRHRLPPLDHANDTLQGREHILAHSGQLHRILLVAEYSSWILILIILEAYYCNYSACG